MGGFISYVEKSFKKCASDFRGSKQGLCPAQSRDLNPNPNTCKKIAVSDLTNVLMVEWKQIPAAMFKNLEEAKGTNSILTTMVVELDVQQ